MRQKTNDPALLYSTRFYKRHRKMVAELTKALKFPKGAYTMRFIVEEAYAKHISRNESRKS